MSIESLALRGKKHPLVLWGHHAHGLLGTAGVDTGQGTGNPVQIAHTGYTGLVGLGIGADADDVCWWVDPKTDLLWQDFGRDIQAQVVFQHAVAEDAQTVWKASIKGYALGAALSDPATAADGSITWPAATTATQHGIYTTSILGFKLTADVFADDELLAVLLECDDMGIAGVAANEIKLICLRLWGTTEMTYEPPTPRQLT